MYLLPCMQPLSVIKYVMHGLPKGWQYSYIYIYFVFLFTATGLTDNCTTSTLFHNWFIQVLYNISANIITVSASIIVVINNDNNPKLTAGVVILTGTEITEKGKLLCNIWNTVISNIYNYSDFTKNPCHQAGR